VRPDSQQEPLVSIAQPGTRFGRSVKATKGLLWVPPFGLRGAQLRHLLLRLRVRQRLRPSPVDEAPRVIGVVPGLGVAVTAVQDHGDGPA
jgi:hypothetical protein